MSDVLNSVSPTADSPLSQGEDSLNPFFSYSQWEDNRGTVAESPLDNLRGYRDYLKGWHLDNGMMSPEVSNEIDSQLIQKAGSIGLLPAPDDKEYGALASALVGPKILSPEKESNIVKRAFGEDAGNQYFDIASNPDADKSELVATLNDAKSLLVRTGEIPYATIISKDGDRRRVIGGGASYGRPLGDAFREAVDIGAVDFVDAAQTFEKSRYTDAQGRSGFDFDALAEVITEITTGADTPNSTLAMVYNRAKQELLEIDQGKRDELSHDTLLMARGSLGRAFAEKNKLKDVNLKGRFTDEEIDTALQILASGDLMTEGKLKFYEDPDKLGSNIRLYGGVPVAPAEVLMQKDLLEKSIEANKGLTGEQERQLFQRRDVLLTASYDAYDKMFTDTAATSDKWTDAKAKGLARGLSKNYILSEFISNPRNYNHTTNTLRELGAYGEQAITGLFTFIGNALGVDATLEYSLKEAEERSKRMEVARIFGEEFGTLTMTVGTGMSLIGDILGMFALSRMGAGAYASVALRKSGASLTGKGLMKNTGLQLFRQKGRETSAQTAQRLYASKLINASSKDVAKEGITKAIKAYNKAIQGTGFNLTTQGLIWANRSSGQMYTSVYGGLDVKEDGTQYTHEEKHDIAMGAALQAGASTVIITNIFRALGLGGFEKAFEKGATFSQMKGVLEKLAGRKLPDKEAQRVLTKYVEGAQKELVPTWTKAWLKGRAIDSLAEGLEEGIDELMQSFIEASATNKDRPMAEHISHALIGAKIGAILGGVATPAARWASARFGGVPEASRAEYEKQQVDNIIERLRESSSPLAAEQFEARVRERLTAPKRQIDEDDTSYWEDTALQDKLDSTPESKKKVFKELSDIFSLYEKYPDSAIPIDVFPRFKTKQDIASAMADPDFNISVNEAGEGVIYGVRVGTNWVGYPLAEGTAGQAEFPFVNNDLMQGGAIPSLNDAKENNLDIPATPPVSSRQDLDQLQLDFEDSNVDLPSVRLDYFRVIHKLTSLYRGRPNADLVKALPKLTRASDIATARASDNYNVGTDGTIYGVRVPLPMGGYQWAGYASVPTVDEDGQFQMSFLDAVVAQGGPPPPDVFTGPLKQMELPFDIQMGVTDRLLQQPETLEQTDFGTLEGEQLELDAFIQSKINQLDTKEKNEILEEAKKQYPVLDFGTPGQTTQLEFDLGDPRRAIQLDLPFTQTIQIGPKPTTEQEATLIPDEEGSSVLPTDEELLKAELLPPPHEKFGIVYLGGGNSTIKGKERTAKHITREGGYPNEVSLTVHFTPSDLPNAEPGETDSISITEWRAGITGAGDGQLQEDTVITRGQRFEGKDDYINELFLKSTDTLRAPIVGEVIKEKGANPGVGQPSITGIVIDFDGEYLTYVRRALQVGRPPQFSNPDRTARAYQLWRDKLVLRSVSIATDEALSNSLKKKDAGKFGLKDGQLAKVKVENATHIPIKYGAHERTIAGVTEKVDIVGTPKAIPKKLIRQWTLEERQELYKELTGDDVSTPTEPLSAPTLFTQAGMTNPDDAYVAYLNGDDNNDNLQALLHEATPDTRDSIVSEWLARNPESAEGLSNEVDRMANDTGYRLQDPDTAEEGEIVIRKFYREDNPYIDTPASQAKRYSTATLDTVLAEAEARVRRGHNLDEDASLNDFRDEVLVTQKNILESRGVARDEFVYEQKDDDATEVVDGSPVVIGEDNIIQPPSERFTEVDIEDDFGFESPRSPYEVNVDTSVETAVDAELTTDEGRLRVQNLVNIAVSVAERNDTPTVVLDTLNDGRSASWFDPESGTMFINPAGIARATYGMTEVNAGRVVRSLVLHEQAHRSSWTELYLSDIVSLMGNTSDAEYGVIINEYYLNDKTRKDAFDRLASDDQNVVEAEKYRLIEERLRMSAERAVTGFTSEEDIAFYSKNPNFLKVVLRYLHGYLNRLLHARRTDAQNPYIASATKKLVAEIRRMRGQGASSFSMRPDPENPQEALVQFYDQISDDRNVDALYTNAGESATQADDVSYRGIHRAPLAGEGASMSNLESMFPDIYTPEGVRYYGDGAAEAAQSNKEIHQLFLDVRGKPETLVTVYRGVPQDASDDINTGDWVTTDRRYAEDHASRYGEYKVLTAEVRAGDLISEGNSIYEFGFDPRAKYVINEGEAPRFLGDAGFVVDYNADGLPVFSVKADSGIVPVYAPSSGIKAESFVEDVVYPKLRNLYVATQQPEARNYFVADDAEFKQYMDDEISLRDFVEVMKQRGMSLGNLDDLKGINRDYLLTSTDDHKGLPPLHDLLYSQAGLTAEYEAGMSATDFRKAVRKARKELAGKTRTIPDELQRRYDDIISKIESNTYPALPTVRGKLSLTTDDFIELRQIMKDVGDHLGMELMYVKNTASRRMGEPLEYELLEAQGKEVKNGHDLDHQADPEGALASAIRAEDEGLYFNWKSKSLEYRGVQATRDDAKIQKANRDVLLAKRLDEIILYTEDQVKAWLDYSDTRDRSPRLTGFFPVLVDKGRVAREGETPMIRDGEEGINDARVAGYNSHQYTKNRDAGNTKALRGMPENWTQVELKRVDNTEPTRNPRGLTVFSRDRLKNASFIQFDMDGNIRSLNDRFGGLPPASFSPMGDRAWESAGDSVNLKGIKTSRQALELVVKGGSRYANIAKLLIKYSSDERLDGTKVNIKQDGFRASASHGHMNLSINEAPQTVIHEFFHVLTAKHVYNHTERGKGTKYFNNLTRYLKYNKNQNDPINKLIRAYMRALRYTAERFDSRQSGNTNYTRIVFDALEPAYGYTKASKAHGNLTPRQRADVPSRYGGGTYKEINRANEDVRVLKEARVFPLTFGVDDNGRDPTDQYIIEPIGDGPDGGWSFPKFTLDPRKVSGSRWMRPDNADEFGITGLPELRPDLAWESTSYKNFVYSNFNPRYQAIKEREFFKHDIAKDKSAEYAAKEQMWEKLKAEFDADPTKEYYVFRVDTRYMAARGARERLGKQAGAKFIKQRLEKAGIPYAESYKWVRDSSSIASHIDFYVEDLSQLQAINDETEATVGYGNGDQLTAHSNADTTHTEARKLKHMVMFVSEGRERTGDIIASMEQTSGPDRASTHYWYGLGNLDEFITETFSSATFQQYLASIPSEEDPNRSILQMFMDAVVKLLEDIGIKGIKVKGTVLEDAIQASLEVAALDPSAHPATRKDNRRDVAAVGIGLKGFLAINKQWEGATPTPHFLLDKAFEDENHIKKPVTNVPWTAWQMQLDMGDELPLRTERMGRQPEGLGSAPLFSQAGDVDNLFNAPLGTQAGIKSSTLAALEKITSYDQLMRIVEAPALEIGDYEDPKGIMRYLKGDLDPRVKQLDDFRKFMLKQSYTAFKDFHDNLKMFAENTYGSVENAPAEIISAAIGSVDGLKVPDDVLDKIQGQYDEDIRRAREATAVRKVDLGDDASPQTLAEAEAKANAELAKLTGQAQQRAAQARLDAKVAVRKKLIKQRDDALAEIRATGGDGVKLADTLVELRKYVDALSDQVSKVYGVKPDLKLHIDLNKGLYLTRSYRMFHEDDWADKVLKDEGQEYVLIRNQAAQFIEDTYIEDRWKLIQESSKEVNGGAGMMTEAEARAQAQLEVDGMAMHGKSMGEQAVITLVTEYRDQGSASAAMGGKGEGYRPLVDNLRNKKSEDELPEPIRNLLGEYGAESYFDNLLRTQLNLSVMVANQSFITQLVQLGRRTEKNPNGWLLTSDQLAEAAAQDPDTYSSYEAIRGRQKAGGKPQEGADDESDVFGALKEGMAPSYDPLLNAVDEEGNLAGELYGPRELILGLRASFDPAIQNKATDAATDFASGLQRWAGKLTGVSLGVKTMGSVGFYTRNIVSNMFFFGPSQGFVNLPKMVNKLVAEGKRLNRWNTAQKLDAKYAEYTLLGIVENEIRPGVIMDLLKGESTPMSLMEDADKLLEQANDSKLGKSVKNTQIFLEKLRDLTAAVDAFYKVAYYENELEFMVKAREHSRQKGLNDSVSKMNDTQLKKAAARKVLMTAQSYSQSPPFVKGVGNSWYGIVFAPFLRFRIEVPRILLNTYKLAREEMNSGNPVLKRRGQVRMGSNIAVVGGLSAAVPMLVSKVLGGVTDEEDEFNRESAPRYLRGHTFFVHKGELIPDIMRGVLGVKSPDNKYSWDLTYLNPYTAMVDPILRSLESVFRGDMGDAASRFVVGMFTSQFLDEQILFGAAQDVFANQNPDTGTPIYEDSDSLMEVLMNTGGFLLGEVYAPPTLERVWKKGNVLGAITGEAGMFDPIAALFREILPVKPYEMNPQNQLERYLRNSREEYDRVRMAKRQMKREILNDSAIREIARNEIERRRRINTRDLRMFEGAQDAGLSKEQVYATAKRKGFGKRRLQLLDRGYMERPVITRNLQRELAQKGDEYVERMRVFMDEVNTYPRYITLD